MKCKYCTQRVKDQAAHTPLCVTLRLACDPESGNKSTGRPADYVSAKSERERKWREKRKQRKQRANGLRHKKQIGFVQYAPKRRANRTSG